MDCQDHKLGLHSPKPAQRRPDKVQEQIHELLVFLTELHNIQILLPTRLQFIMHLHLSHRDMPPLLAEVTMSSNQTRRLKLGDKRELPIEMRVVLVVPVVPTPRHALAKKETLLEEHNSPSHRPRKGASTPS